MSPFLQTATVKVLIRGGGDLASGVAWRLHQSGFRVGITEISEPLSVRRKVALCEAVYEGRCAVAGVQAVLVKGPEEAARVWNQGFIPAGGIPKKKHLRYTRMAEAFPAMILMLYDPSTSWGSEEDKESDELPIIAGTAFIIAWKVRGGFRAHLDEAPGAIQVSFRGDVGWGDRVAKWHSLKKVSYHLRID